MRIFAVSDIHVDYDVNVTKPHYTGGIRYKFNGPALYGVLTF